MFSTVTSVVASPAPVVSQQLTADARLRFSSVADLHASVIDELMPTRQQAEWQHYQNIQQRAGPSAALGYPY